MAKNKLILCLKQKSRKSVLKVYTGIIELLVAAKCDCIENWYHTNFNPCIN